MEKKDLELGQEVVGLMQEQIDGYTDDDSGDVEIDAAIELTAGQAIDLISYVQYLEEKAGIRS